MSQGRWIGLVLLLVAGAFGYQWWQANQVPPPSLEPGESAVHVDLSAPDHVEIHHEQTQSSIMIARDNGRDDGRLGGRTPEMFQRPAIASGSLALARNAAPMADGRPWWQRLDAKFMIIVVAAIFLAVYGILTAALKRGPGGGGMSND